MNLHHHHLGRFTPALLGIRGEHLSSFVIVCTPQTGIPPRKIEMIRHFLQHTVPWHGPWVTRRSARWGRMGRSSSNMTPAFVIHPRHTWFLMGWSCPFPSFHFGLGLHLFNIAFSVPGTPQGRTETCQCPTERHVNHIEPWLFVRHYRIAQVELGWEGNALTPSLYKAGVWLNIA